ncbi:hypothetical protein DOTSEDRAFT_30959 [Dothistroma septosporum NZE10]|uniref:Uncharacterized protein n=1 Tax=Dothistroma septosporum (strain NZE10 / CBS 128990) TaxID=675120 RepID=N1Q203_DOTSN|nr:hypothetical protein DOTSEDRAFT_30959 [Dothistroma septosporum NZE10]
MAALAMCMLLLTTTGHCYLTSMGAQITPRPSAYPAVPLDQGGQSQQFWRRTTMNFCDDQGIFQCPTGTCYEYQGLIGCCSVSSCAPRTTCIDYEPIITAEPCDRNTGGCLYCNDPSVPYCRTQTNPLSSQYNHYCDAVGGTVTVTNGIFAGPTALPSTGIHDSKTLPPSGETPTIVSAVPVPSSTGGKHAAVLRGRPSNGLIVGLVCGTAGAAILAAAAFWCFRSWHRLHWEDQEDKPRGLADATAPSIHHDGADGVPNGNAAADKDQTAATPIVLGDSRTDHRLVDDLGSWTPGLAYSADDGKRYTVTDPDSDSNSFNNCCSTRDFARCHAAAQAPPGHADQPVLVGASSFSPSTSNDTAPPWTRSNTRLSSPVTAHTPYTPSQYHDSAPNSITKAFLHPPSLPQDYSAATFLSDATRVTTGSYTPSNYQSGAPVSVARAAPLHMPQEYSAATLAPGSRDGSPVYRGLRSSSSNAFPPHAYLSAEEALAGGWRNDSPPGGVEH